MPNFLYTFVRLTLGRKKLILLKIVGNEMVLCILKNHILFSLDRYPRKSSLVCPVPAESIPLEAEDEGACFADVLQVHHLFRGPPFMTSHS